MKGKTILSLKASFSYQKAPDNVQTNQNFADTTSVPSLAHNANLVPQQHYTP